MGISNSLGSNTFNILLCLGFPWLIKTLIAPTISGQPWVRTESFQKRNVVDHNSAFRSPWSRRTSHTLPYRCWQHSPPCFYASWQTNLNLTENLASAASYSTFCSSSLRSSPRRESSTSSAQPSTDFSRTFFYLWCWRPFEREGEAIKCYSHLCDPIDDNLNLKSAVLPW